MDEPASTGKQEFVAFDAVLLALDDTSGAGLYPITPDCPVATLPIANVPLIAFVLHQVWDGWPHCRLPQSKK
jgi:hypothetical protein